MAIAGVIWGRNVGGRIFTDVPEHFTSAEGASDEKELPSFGMVLAIVLTPLCLILLGTLSSYIPMPAELASILAFLGKPFVALTLATLVAMYLLGARRGYSGAELKALLDRSLKPVGMILLVIACGGVTADGCRTAGLGQIIGPMLEASPLPLVVVAFLIAVMVRASVGSSIVAMTMASGHYGRHAPRLPEPQCSCVPLSVLPSAAVPRPSRTSTMPVFGCAPRSWRLTRRPPSSPGPLWRRSSAFRVLPAPW